MITVLQWIGRKDSLASELNQESFVQTVLLPTFKGLEALVDPTTGLPYDIVHATTLKLGELVGPDNPYKASGLANALYLASLVAKRDLGLEQREAVAAKIGKALQSLGNEKANQTITFTDVRGNRVTATFPYKWPHPQTAERTVNFQIPAIESGQLAYSLAVLTEAFKDTAVAAQAQKLLDRMDFRLFERPDGLLALAYEQGQLKGAIDYWGNEGIVSALLGIVKDGVSLKALPFPKEEPGASVVTYTASDGRKIRVIPDYDGSLAQ